MSRYKDADALKRKIETMYREPDIQENLPYNLAIAEVLEVIDEFPSANVVEVVRCEKCVYADHTMAEKITLTMDKDLALDMAYMFESYIFQLIRDDPEIDNIKWFAELLQ